MTQIMIKPSVELIEKLSDSASAVFKDFPEPGVNFFDIGNLLADPEAYSTVVDFMIEQVVEWEATHIVGLDGRGFNFSAPVAVLSHLPLIMARKEGKLPGALYKSSYRKEYGSTVDTITIQKVRLGSGDRVVIIDDIIATGGTVCAACDVVKMSGAEIVGVLAFVDIPKLKGKEIISHKYDVPVNQTFVYEY